MIKKAIFILGMHRSGTSAITGMLNHLGAAMPKTLMVPQPDNPKGFFESYAIMALSEKMLEAAGSKWDGWQAIDLDLLGDRFDADIVAVTQDEFGDAPLIAIKDPRQCRIAPPWFSALEQHGYEPVAILPYRHALEVAHSLKKRNGMPLARGLLMWLRHVLDAEYYSRSYRRAFVYMPDLLSDWRSCVADLVQKLDIEWATSADESAGLIDEHLDKDLKHHSYAAEDFDNEPLLRDWIKTTFFALEGLRLGHDVDQHQQALDGVRALMDRAAVLLGPSLDAAEALAEERAQLVAAQGAELADLRSRQEVPAQSADFTQERQAFEQTLAAVSHESEAHRQHVMRLAEALHKMEVQFAVIENQNRNLSDIMAAKDETVRIAQAGNEALEKRLTVSDMERETMSSLLLSRDEKLLDLSGHIAELQTAKAYVEQGLIAANEDRERGAALLQVRDKSLFELEGELVRLRRETLAEKAALAESLHAKMAEVHMAQAEALREVNQSYSASVQTERRQVAVITEAYEAEKLKLVTALHALEAAEESGRSLSATVQKYRSASASDFAIWAVQKKARP